MILNYDCLRDVLLCLEKNLILDGDLRFKFLNLEDIFKYQELAYYSKKDIYYCVHNLLEIDFIHGSIQYADAGIPYVCLISHISYEGHNFLQSIKSESTWENIKSKIKPVAGLSIPLITEVSKEIIVSSLGIC